MTILDGKTANMRLAYLLAHLERFALTLEARAREAMEGTGRCKLQQRIVADEFKAQLGMWKSRLEKIKWEDVV